MAEYLAEKRVALMAECLAEMMDAKVVAHWVGMWADLMVEQ